MNRVLTSEEAGRVLERLDQSEPELQRRVLATMLYEAFEFRKLVREMRFSQIAYFKTRRSSDLRESKDLEKRVDQAVYLKPGYRSLFE